MPTNRADAIGEEVLPAATPLGTRVPRKSRHPGGRN
jgi:hypothetical protein